MGDTILAMFAMLRGPWPRVTADGTTVEAVEAQVVAGMGLVTDGQVRWSDPVTAMLAALSAKDTGPGGMLVRAWKATAALTDRQVAQAIPGPWTLAMREVGMWADLNVVGGQALGHAEALAGELAALGAAGCAVVVIEEPAVVGLGASARAHEAFVRAHRRLLRDTPDLHAMLAIAGGSANHAGPEVIFGAPYKSHLFDLIAGPDNWYLIRQAPGERGIVCAVLVAAPGLPDADQSPMLVWAAQYAASSNGRGLDRIGLANASPLISLSPDVAARSLDGLARAAAFAVMPLAEAVEAGLDRRALDRMPRPPQA